MTDQVPTTTDIEEFESAKDLFRDYSGISRLKRFWRTRTAILEGEALYDFSKKKLESLGLMGPWKFNLTQSSLAGIPSLVLLGVFHLIQKITGTTTDREIELAQTLKTLAVPFVLLFSAFISARATFIRSDSTKYSRSVAVRAFLYFDAAYGFYPQMGIAIYLTLRLILGPALLYDPGTRPSLAETALGLLIMAFIYAGIVPAFWQLVVHFKTIPAELFRAMGYCRPGEVLDPTITLFADPVSSHQGVTLSREYPPIWKYRIAVAIVIPVVTFGVLILLAVVEPLIVIFK